MQDFTKQNATLSNLNTKQPKWLNKDRLWNFVFWFGMSFGMATSAFVKANLGLLTLSKVIMWSTIFAVPFMVTLLNKTTFIKKDTFANSEGVLISKKQMPYSFPLAAISGFAIAFIVAELFLPRGDKSFFAGSLFSLSLFSGISLYFILKNCPISILFNRRFWTFEFKAGGVVNSHYRSSNDMTRTSNDYYYHPSYRHLPGNIYHR